MFLNIVHAGLKPRQEFWTVLIGARRLLCVCCLTGSYRVCVWVCRPRVDHYFPDLHHLKFEIEEGTTPDGRAVRFGYDRLEFGDFSWRGYAQMSPIQVGRLETRTGLRLQHLTDSHRWLCVLLLWP